MIAARELLDYALGKAFIADIAYDSNDFRAEIKARGLKAVIHSKPERSRSLTLDRTLYRIRDLVEVRFHSLERFPAIGTRDEKTGGSYLAPLHVACICLWFA